MKERKTVTVFLKNGFQYTGEIISQKDLLIDFFDYKLDRCIWINKESISTIIPQKEVRQND